MTDAKQVVAFPLYRNVPVEWFMNWLKMAKTGTVASVAVDGLYLPTAMQTLVDLAFTNCGDFDRIVFFEQDMLPPLNGLTRMAQYGDEYDIVGTVYFKHDLPHHVMAWMQVDKPRFSPLTRDVVKLMVDEPGLYEVDGVAMGFTSIHRRVFEEWNPDVSMWYPSPPFVGHDLHFCNEALKPQHGPNRDQGFKIWVDSGIGCGHLTLIPIGYDDSQAALAENEPQNWAEYEAANGEEPSVVMGGGELTVEAEPLYAEGDGAQVQ